MSSVRIEQLICSEPRFTMNIVERSLARLIISLVCVLLIATTITALASGVSWLVWTGILLTLILADGAFHFGKAEKNILLVPENTDKIINAARYLSPASFHRIEETVEKAAAHETPIPITLFKILVEAPEIEEGILRIDVSLKELKKTVEAFFHEQKGKQETSRKETRERIEKVVTRAWLHARNAREHMIEERHLFTALLNINDPVIEKICSLFSIQPNDVETALLFAKFHSIANRARRLPRSLGHFIRSHTLPERHRIMNRAWTARPTPTLDQFSRDLTDAARSEEVGLLIGHEKEYHRMVNAIAREHHANALLVGDAGNGKETIMAHLAHNIVKDTVPKPLFDKRLVILSISSLASGASPEAITARMHKVMQEIVDAGNIILAIPDIHLLFTTSGEHHLNAANTLLPAVTGDAFPVIGTTFPNEYTRVFEPQGDFQTTFETIRVEEISEAEAIRVLTYESILLERTYNLIISFAAIKKAVATAHQYLHDAPLPGRAQDLLREAAADAAQKKIKVLRAEHVVETAEQKTNVPIRGVQKKEAQQLLHLEELIHEKLVGQDEAVAAVSRSLREYRSGLRKSHGPIAAFLFVGPTGVGKTELSKILASIHFGSENAMIRFDMSEYQTPEHINQLIGSPDGMVMGRLTEAVRKTPYALILLDEFEKAHPDLLNLFLQVLDDGRLTDNTGRTVDFSHTIIIATSNAHSDFVKKQLEAESPIDIIAEQLKKKLITVFRPELLNRFSEVIVFKPLSRQEIEKIVRLQLREFVTNAEEQGIELTVENAVIEKLAKWGYDPTFGARPLREVISEKLRSPLAEKILKGDIIRGMNVTATIRANRIAFIKKEI